VQFGLNTSTFRNIKHTKLFKMKKKSVLSILCIFSVLCLQAQSSGSNDSGTGTLKGGIRIQKAQKLYWENGFSFDFASPKIADSRIHFGASYVTSRLGSAIGSNAIKQDNYIISTGYHFRHKKYFQPFTRLNAGYFHADYEEDIFDVLPNSSFLFSVDAGCSYEFNIPLTVSLSAGYNVISGTGTSGPGTLYPVFYQISVFYTIFKK
jgi:hypothetical protein